MVVVLLAQGFEEVEALTCVDLLRRAQIEVITVGCGSKTVQGSNDICVVADKELDELTNDQCMMIKMLVIPGGMGGVTALMENPKVTALLETVHNSNAYLAAICSGPIVLGAAGMLNGKNVVCYPDTGELLTDSNILTDTSVCVDGKIITSRSMATAIDFALTLINELKGEAKCDLVRQSILYTK